MNAYRSTPPRRHAPGVAGLSHRGFRPAGLRLTALGLAAPGLAALGFAVLVLGCGPRSSGEPLVTRAGDLTLTASLAPDPPKVTGNSLRLAIAGAEGEPVTGAQIEVGYFMPAMGTMAEMKGQASLSEEGDGRYVAAFDLPMNGRWSIDTTLDTGDSRVEVEYLLTVDRSGLSVQSSTPPSGPRAAAATGSAPATGNTALPELVEHIDEFHGGDQEISHYTCSMHPSVEQEGPGTCPICSMNLVPVSRREVETGIITIDAQQRRTIGVRTAPVTRRSATVRIRAEGRVTFDESRITNVTTRYRGWVRGLSVDRTGQYVSRGQVLFKLYSPELYAAQEELLVALASQEAARRTLAPERADYLVAAARKRLRLWDIETEQIDRIVASGEPIEFLPVVSPAAGYVVEKEIVDGDAIEPGRRLYRIAALDRIWVEADVYEAQLPLVAVGQSAEITLPYLPGRKFRGRVSFVYPYLDAASRTGRVRIELPNPELTLKPEMYANIELLIDRGEQLLVPESAVLYAGPRRLVFVDLGGGRLRPQEVEIGIRSGDDYEVLSGLEAGDEVVVSGNFLVAAESRLKSATENW